MYDKARAKGHVVPFELLGQGLGLCIEVKHARGEVADTGVAAMMDDLFESSKPFSLFLRCQYLRIQSVDREA